MGTVVTDSVHSGFVVVSLRSRGRQACYHLLDPSWEDIPFEEISRAIIYFCWRPLRGQTRSIAKACPFRSLHDGVHVLLVR